MEALAHLYKAHPVEIRLTAFFLKSWQNPQKQGNSKLLSSAIKPSESAKTISIIQNPNSAVTHSNTQNTQIRTHKLQNWLNWGLQNSTKI